MGYSAAVAMRQALRYDAALVWHLQYNHYPPLPIAFAPLCKQAIAHVNDGDSDARLRLPRGITVNGKRTMTASQCVELCNLASFMEVED